MKTKGVVKGFITTDHHTIHPNTPTKHILGNLSQVYYGEIDSDNHDIHLFLGDLYHDLAYAPNPEYLSVKRWFKDYFKYCSEKDIIVRILAGTFSHDWDQPKDLMLLVPEGADIKFIDKIELEYIDKLKIWVLYIPDNLGGLPHTDIWNKALELMGNAGIEQVDFTLAHCAFQYQLPMVKPNHGYDEDLWMSITKHCIYSGHIHPRSIYKKIHCVGSFDRTIHGEEHPKGGLEFTLDHNNQSVVNRFHENKNALPYITIKATDEDTAVEISNKLAKLVNEITIPNAHIRIKDGRSELIKPLIKDYQAAYPMFNFKYEGKLRHTMNMDDQLFSEDTYKGVSLTKTTLPILLLDRIKTSSEADLLDMKYVKSVLHEFL